MWLCHLGGTSSSGVSPYASAVISSSSTYALSTGIRCLFPFFFNHPVDGELLGVQIFHFSALHGGIALVVEKEAIGLRHCCRFFFNPFKKSSRISSSNGVYFPLSAPQSMCVACDLSWAFPVALISCRKIAVVVPSAQSTVMMGVTPVSLDIIVRSKSITPGSLPPPPLQKTFLHCHMEGQVFL